MHVMKKTDFHVEVEGGGLHDPSDVDLMNFDGCLIVVYLLKKFTALSLD